METLAFDEIKATPEYPQEHGVDTPPRIRSKPRSLAASLAPAQQLWVLDPVSGQVGRENSEGEVENVFANFAESTFNCAL